MDFQKAFDSVPHERLLKKLQHYGITGDLYNWIKDFLQGRTQQVVINNESSTPLPVTSGVPQGSVLGPVLFVLYINDLPSNVTSNAYLFADDAKIFRPMNSAENSDQQDYMQNDLNALQEWSDTWLLKFHPDKCVRLHIHRRLQDPRQQDLFLQKTDPEGNITRTSLKTVSHHKDLGIIVDDGLTFEKHINNITNKANQMMGLICRTFRHLNKETFIPLYVALVRSRLEYGQAVWSPYLKKNIRRIEQVQRRATKRVPGLRDLDYSSRLRALNLPTLQYRRLRGDMVEVYKIMQQVYDPKTSIEMPPMQSHLRGHNFKLFQIRATSEMRKNAFRSRVVRPWNSLSQHVVSGPTMNAFKRRLDKEWANHPLLFYSE